MGSAYADKVLQAATMIDAFRLANVIAPNDPNKNIKCPMHNDSTPSFHMQKSGKGWKCFGPCGEGGMIDFLVKIGTAPTKRDALLMLGDLHRIPREDGQGASFTQRRKRIAPPPFVPLPPEQRVVAPPEARQKLRDALAGCCGLLTPEGARGAAYLRTRGIETDAADVNDVRFNLSWLGEPAVVFAVRDERGRIVAANGRFLHPTAKPKAKSLGFIGIGAYTTEGALQSSGPVAITEAPLDALSLAVNGLPAIALIGCGLKPWLRRVLRFRSVIIATDDDDTGNKTAEALRLELTLSTVARFAFPPKPNGLTKKQDVNDWLRADSTGLRQYVQTLLLADVA